MTKTRHSKEPHTQIQLNIVYMGDFLGPEKINYIFWGTLQRLTTDAGVTVLGRGRSRTWRKHILHPFFRIL